MTRPGWGFVVLLDTTLLVYLVISNELAVPARAAAAFRARRRPSARLVTGLLILVKGGAFGL
ncbi:hypothetical protein ACFWHV_21870 [Streptomyces collinus]|uniref:hypothetical protein n=1 Tax=Streptomyces collinus TaxID=42684 RepID=UPI0036576361